MGNFGNPRTRTHPRPTHLPSSGMEPSKIVRTDDLALDMSKERDSYSCPAFSRFYWNKARIPSPQRADPVHTHENKQLFMQFLPTFYIQIFMQYRCFRSVDANKKSDKSCNSDENNPALPPGDREANDGERLMIITKYDCMDLISRFQTLRLASQNGNAERLSASSNSFLRRTSTFLGMIFLP
ncbi:hypothetical protein HYFRA_00000623 [Hymenoscyphus fraxineus]|uniref:Uncharacterized protein n=1 Tax=Hymenoscyphus fraxineus TaxID=746836 RepID=A0A9N9PWX4_9HELO|nr:hypothetical protein HYFRA_00000623 [Hymenoscyphus fraxineus]